MSDSFDVPVMRMCWDSTVLITLYILVSFATHDFIQDGERADKLTLSWMKDYVDFDIYFHLVYEHNNEDRSLSDFRGEDYTINYKGGMWKLDLFFSPEMFSMNSLLAMIDTDIFSQCYFVHRHL